MMDKHHLIGRIADLSILSVPEFGTRVSFKLEGSGSPITCCIAGDVAREFIAYFGEGDIVAVDGVYEPRPSTASSRTPWIGRFRVRALCVLEPTRSAA